VAGCTPPVVIRLMDKNVRCGVFLRHVYMHVCECSQRYAYGLGVYRIRRIQW